MACLFKFPPEIWASVTFFVPGEALGRLKITGSKTFWGQLTANRAVKSIILGRNWVCLDRPLPSFLLDLPNLEELIIINREDDPIAQHITLEAWEAKLSDIPKSVTNLKLVANQNMGPFFTSKDGNILSLIEHVPSLTSLDINVSWSDEHPFLALVPSTLTSLKCSDWNGSLPLPDSLIRLETTQNIHLGSVGELKLPPQLAIIATNEIISDDKLVALLPPGIQIIRTHQPMQSALKMLPQLPQSISQLGLIDLGSQPDQPSTLTLPSQLVSLAVAHLPSESWANLPSTLEILKLHELTLSNCIVPRSLSNPLTGETHSFHTLPLNTLPRSIKRLKLRFKEYLDIFPLIDCDPVKTLESDLTNSCRYFPPSLTKLTVRFAKLTANGSKQLPPSLKILDLSHFDNSICEHLPRGLTKLSSTHVLASLGLVKNLPRSLTSLTMVNKGFYKGTPWNDPVIGKPTTAGELLEVDPFDSELLWSGEYCLPPNLRDLILLNFLTLDDTFLKQDLSNLRALACFGNRFTDTTISLLPRHLLVLHLSNAASVTGKSFADLPPTLTHLTLSQSKEICDLDIKQLPRSLIAFVAESSNKLTGACLKDLPRTLSQFTISPYSGSFYRSSFADLPHNIRVSKSFLRLRTPDELVLDLGPDDLVLDLGPEIDWENNEDDEDWDLDGDDPFDPSDSDSESD